MIMKKMLSFMKDQEDMSMIGPVIKEQQKIMNECTEKKISLVKLQNLLLKQSLGKNMNNAPMGKLTLTEEEKTLLDRLVNDGGNTENNDNYTL
jgi:hypothetical protein